MNTRYNGLPFFLLAVALMFVTGCRDDNDFRYAGGNETTITVDVALPEMVKLETRASQISNEDANRVQDLWVGIYNQRTGKCVLYQDGSDTNPTGDVEDGDVAGKLITGITHKDTHLLHSIGALNTISGPSYIVAVANVENNNGTNGTDTGSLKDLLQAADTWEKFLAISYVADLNEDGSASVLPPHAIPMSGCYYGEATTDPEVGSWANVNYSTVDIPRTSGNLTGAIHLRRMVSQVTFNVGSDNSDIESIELLQWQVVNVPRASWVYEKNNEAGTLNAGDDLASDASYFQRSPVHKGDDIQTGGNNSYNFTFFTQENKRVGNVPTTGDDNTRYNLRAKENGGTANENAVRDFTYLEGNNNRATYVEFKARISFKQSEGTKRTAYATYRVHLGYINDDKANDFASVRNAKYVYNVKIKDVNSIVVEAQKLGENVPGSNGEVIDITNEYITLDAHYHVFNISLSNAERTGRNVQTAPVDPDQTDPNRRLFTFVIRAYLGNTLYEVDESSDFSGDNLKFLKWVELRRTTGENVLAPYAPYDPNTNNTTIYGNTFRLNDVQKIETYKGYADRRNTTSPNAASTTQQWYTVYVHENAYDDDKVDWKQWVNTQSRTVQLRTVLNVSDDKQSTQVQAKYAFDQKSIQTFYDMSRDYGSGSTEQFVLGVEHTNETYGQNLRAAASYNNSAQSGRYGVVSYLGINGTGSSSVSWSNYVNVNTPYSYPNISNDTQDPNWNSTSAGKKTYLSSIATQTTTGLTTGYPQPGGSTTTYVEVARACMNRNIDLNGNGYIDRNEIKWYTPATEELTQVILGRASLATPILPHPEQLPQIYGSAGEGYTAAWSDNNSRFHYLTADKKAVWLEEGFSVSPWNVYTTTGWDVRCVRVLGNSINLSKQEDAATDIIYPYVYQSTGSGNDTRHYVRMKYYELASKNAVPITSNNGIQPHSMYDDLDKMSRGFEFENFDRALESITAPSLTTSGNQLQHETWFYYLNNYNPCAAAITKTGRSGWRVPSIKELSILSYVLSHRAGLTQFSGQVMSASFEHWDRYGVAYIMNADPINPLGWRRFMNYNGNLTAGTINYLSAAKVRCVRDLTAAEITALDSGN